MDSLSDQSGETKNEMKLIYPSLLTLSLLMMLTFISCRGNTMSPTATLPPATTISGASSQPSLEHSTISPLPTATMLTEQAVSISADLTPTRLPTAIATMVTPSPTPAPPTNVSVTFTPLPTLAPEELERAVEELLASPMNCNVPCWWGAIPGVTSLDEIKHAISPYNFDIYESVVDEKLTILRLGIGYIEERNDFEVRIGYGFSNSILTTVSAYSPSVFEVLARYGQPDEVWLSTGITPAPIPVRLNLVYYQEGMAFGYVVDGFVENHMFNGCFTAEKGGRLRLITPNSATSYKDFPTIFWDDQHYLPLEEATSLTMEDFMQHFSDPTQPQCVETPAELWD